MATGRLPDPNSAPVTSKGDLYTYSTRADRLAVGNNGETLVADSSTTTGLRWQGIQAAGRNAIINGGFDIWQRGTSSTASATYGAADRWYQFIGAGSGTWARESTIVPSGSRYALKFTASANGTAHSTTQYMETSTISPFIGKTIVVSAQVAASTSTSMYVNLEYSTTVDAGTGATWVGITASSGGNATPTSTTFVPLSATFAVPTNAASLRVVFGTNATMANTNVIYIGNVQLELGSVPTPFTRAGGTLAGELAACQRYYYRIVGGGVYGHFGQGIASSTTNVRLDIQAPVPMRIAPTAVDFSTVTNLCAYDGVNVVGLTALTIDTSQTSARVHHVQGTASGLTQYRPYFFMPNNDATGYVGFTAEL